MTRMSRLAVALGAMATVAGCFPQPAGKDPKPTSLPTPLPPSAASPATQPGVNDADTLAARVSDWIRRTGPAATQPGKQFPRIMDPAEASTQPSGVQFNTPATPPGTLAPAPATQPAAMSPAPASPAAAPMMPMSAEPDVDAGVRARLAKNPSDVTALLDGQLLAYLREQPAPSAAAIQGLPAEDRELISAVVDALVNFRAAVRADPGAMYASRVRPLTEMADRLRLRADLSIPVIQVCSAVRGFGSFDPLPAALSTRGETPAVLYFEVKDFTSRYNAANEWETTLSASAALFDSAGHAVWHLPAQTYRDVCRNRRQDFFISTKVRVPPVPPGRYTLKITLTDMNVGRMTEGAMSVEAK